MAKDQELLLHLVHRGEMVNIDQIFEDLWPEIPQDKAQSAFYSVAISGEPGGLKTRTYISLKK